MDVKWVLEEICHEDTVEDLKASLKKQGIDFKSFVSLPFTDKIPDLYGKEECVVVHGSIQACQNLQRNTSWIPGPWLNAEALACKNYYAHFGQYLLNSKYAMLPFGELKRCKEFLVDTLGVDGCVFIRPSSGLKCFVGQPIFAEKWDYEVDNTLGFYDVSPDTLCVVAPPVHIEREWRFIVAEGKVVTGSLYLERKQRVRKLNESTEALDFAQKMVDTGFNPDPVWVVDVAEAPDGLHLLEVGAFSCCGLYKCDTDIIVEAVSKAAINEWKDIMEV